LASHYQKNADKHKKNDKNKNNF
jgi:hypothetical protein